MNLNDQAKLLRNDGGNRNNWLTVSVKLPDPHRDAIGARVAVKVDGVFQVQDMIPVRGYLSQVDPRAHFGCGQAKKVESVQVRWPNQEVQVLKDVPDLFRRPEIRMTLDYEDDFLFFKRIIEHFVSIDEAYTLRDIIAFLDKHPEVIKINQYLQEQFLENQQLKTKLLLKGDIHE